MPSRTTTALGERIYQQIADHPAKSISFAAFMRSALYDPQQGYYSDPGRRVGREGGDFYTSVSVGDTFGRLLAAGIATVWRELDRPAMFRLVEQGAHDGQLALDILTGLAAESEAGLVAALHYLIIEPSPSRRDLLKRRFAEAGCSEEIEVVTDAAAARSKQAGLFLCNELVDALPVHRVRWGGEAWVQLRVGVSETGFDWTEAEIEPGSPLAAEVARIDTQDFTAGYTTEINLVMFDWLKEVGGLFGPGCGRWWIIDYGHTNSDYFAPSRREGTLRCYRDHRASDDPFSGIGETDLTAHVNFTRLAESGQQAGLKSTNAAGPVDQHDFLTHLAVDWLHSLERGTADGTALSAADQARVRQFQTLTHPGMMGRVFKVLELVN